jgi:hypothetical protein
VSIAAHVLDLLVPGSGEQAIAPPGEGDGFWAGGPSVHYGSEGFWLAYRLRRPVTEGRGYANIVAHSEDGVHFETVATVTAAQFDSASLERPAIVRLPNGGWRLYVSCSTFASKHWWVEALDSDTPEGLADGRRAVVLAGAEGDAAWKDIVVHEPSGDGRWHMWACRHPLDGGDDEADRMTTHYLTSADGLHWSDRGACLVPTAGSWNARGTRVTSVLREAAGWTAFYDGRASADENWHERTGVAFGPAPSALTASLVPTPAGHTARYVSLATLDMGYRVFWEASRSDGAHDLRTAYVPR